MGWYCVNVLGLGSAYWYFGNVVFSKLVCGNGLGLRSSGWYFGNALGCFFQQVGTSVMLQTFV